MKCEFRNANSHNRRVRRGRGGRGRDVDRDINKGERDVKESSCDPRGDPGRHEGTGKGA